MSFQTPPTFVDGDVLSASQLNLLAANQNYLSGAAGSNNPAFAEVAIDNNVTDMYYEIVHTYDNLYVRCNLTGSPDLHIYYGSTKVAEITSSGSNAENIDLSSFGLTKGQRYRVRFAWAGGGGDTDDIIITWARETEYEV